MGTPSPPPSPPCCFIRPPPQMTDMWTKDWPKYDRLILDFPVPQPFYEVEPIRLVKVHGSSMSLVPAVHKDLLGLSRRFGIRLNSLHRFMRHASVWDAVEILLNEIMTMRAPYGLGGPGVVNDTVPSFENVRIIVSNYMRKGNRWIRWNILRKHTEPGPDYVCRSYANCMAKLNVLYLEGQPSWSFSQDDHLFFFIIVLFRQNYAIMKRQCPIGLTPAIWKHWIKDNDPWIMPAGKYTLSAGTPADSFQAGSSQAGLRRR